LPMCMSVYKSCCVAPVLYMSVYKRCCVAPVHVCLQQLLCCPRKYMSTRAFVLPLYMSVYKSLCFTRRRTVKNKPIKKNWYGGHTLQLVQRSLGILAVCFETVLFVSVVSLQALSLTRNKRNIIRFFSIRIETKNIFRFANTLQ
jgi:hypothetical protein